MVLLAFMPALCHRKAISAVALNVVVVNLLTATCQSESLTTGRTVEDVRNPRIETDKCGRKGVVSSVCDPDNVISSGEGKLSY